MSDYQIDIHHEGRDYSVDADLERHGEAYDVPPSCDDPGGLDITREPEFSLEVYYYCEDSGDYFPTVPDEKLAQKANEMLQEIYWDRYGD